MSTKKKRLEWVTCSTAKCDRKLGKVSVGAVYQFKCPKCGQIIEGTVSTAPPTSGHDKRVAA